MTRITGVREIAELRASGMSPGAVRHAARTGRLVRVRRGIYCDGDVWRSSQGSPAQRHAIDVYAVWLALGRRGWATGYSAALLLDLPVPIEQPDAVIYSLPRRAHGRRRYPGLRLRTATVDATDVVLVRGVPACAPARTSLDVAREHGFSAGLALADAGLRRGIVDLGELREIVDRMAGWAGSRHVHLVGDHASGAREAPSESFSYAAFVAGGLALPDCNAWVVGRPGAGGIRADFVWPLHRLVGEVDGRVKYTDPLWTPRENVLVDEKTRQLRIEEAGFVVVRWTGAEAMYQPEVVLRRIVRQSKLAADMFGVPALTSPFGMAR